MINYIDLIPENSVIVIDNDGRQDCTAWGAILTKAAQIKGLAGTVVHGAVRDLPSIRESQYPVFSSGTYMRSGKNRIKKTGEQCPLMIHSVTIYPGDIIFGDDNGVLVIPKDQLEDIIYKAQNIQRTEQYITQAIKNGSTLAQARIDFHYDQAWLEQKGQDIESD